LRRRPVIRVVALDEKADWDQMEEHKVENRKKSKIGVEKKDEELGNKTGEKKGFNQRERRKNGVLNRKHLKRAYKGETHTDRREIWVIV